ncbi:L-alanine exporter AlaE [Endozoicomonas gorgoniicola]|uniref:L-alanine exporter AlaE n=1 Tax=Endozoicomonas gorgoniicola TaxID=1234144 RepID=A0ABT3MQ99_9GAMM|nr:L-alanine exporter AlaE [Endozoicomonas gorgoniicola]MCW7551556.1 L-alanine exporter AlaE [Endozoicomonas gorgoniicola]
MSIKRETIADTFALISFGLVVGMSVELFVAGLSIEQSLHSRLLSIPVNLLVARAYGIYRDWVMAQGRKMTRNSLMDSVMDIVAFLTFQMPVYAVLVGTSGASLDQVITACMGQLGALILMARPYGIYMQMCRNWFAERATVQTA